MKKLGEIVVTDSDMCNRSPIAELGRERFLEKIAGDREIGDFSPGSILLRNLPVDARLVELKSL